MKSFKRIFSVSASILLLTFFSGCKMQLKIAPEKSGSVKLNFSSALGPNFISAVQEMIQARNNFLDEEEQIPPSTNLSELFHSKTIQDELNDSFFSNSQIDFPENNSIQVNTRIPEPEKIPASLLTTEKLSDGRTKLSINISYESLKASVLSDDSYAKNYADILMAPVCTGEVMTLDEYKDLLISVYGEALTEELLSDSLYITFVSPDGKKKKEISVPLEKFLISIDGIKDEFIY